MKTKLLIFFMMLVMVLSACGPEKSQRFEFSSINQAWIDAPLPGSKLPLALVEIVAHATSPDGIASFEINLNGQLLAKTDPDPSSIDPSMMYTRYNWQPAAPGLYLIEVKAINSKNQAGQAAQSLVEVVGTTPTIPPIETLTFTPTPTLTTTPTLTPTITLTPGPSPIVFTNNRVNTSQIYIGRPGCGRREVDIYITIPAASEVTMVSIKYQMVDRLNKSHTTEWVTEQMSLVTAGGIEWIVSVSPESEILGASRFAKATLKYQFTATNVNGKEASEFYSNVKVDYCGLP